MRTRAPRLEDLILANDRPDLRQQLEAYVEARSGSGAVPAPEQENFFRRVTGNTAAGLAQRFGLSPGSVEGVRNVAAVAADFTPFLGGLTGVEDFLDNMKKGNYGAAAIDGLLIAAAPLPPLMYGGKAVRAAVRKARKSSSSRSTQYSHRLKDDRDIIFNGKQPKDFLPEDWEAFGKKFGVERLGPMTPLERVPLANGSFLDIPGGLDGKWTFYDLLQLQSSGIGALDLPEEVLAGLHRKLGRTLTPQAVTDEHVWEGLMFGMLSRGTPLSASQLAQSRLRMRLPEVLDEVGDMIPWKAGTKVSRADRKKYSRQIAEKLGIQADEYKQLLSGRDLDFTDIAELAQLFRKNPGFFRLRPGEDWTHLVERIASQVRGMGIKTGSLAVGWQDPMEAAVQAIDRHMGRHLLGKVDFFKSVSQRKAWEKKTLDRWNASNKRHFKSWAELLADPASDGFVGTEVARFLSVPRRLRMRLKSGQLNPKVDPGVEYIVEPEFAQMMSEAYKTAYRKNAEAAKKFDLGAFMGQTMDYSRQRNRFEVYPNMFPGLYKLPPQSRRQLEEVRGVLRQQGFFDSSKTATGPGGAPRMKPTRHDPGNPSGSAVLGMGGAALGGGALASGANRPGSDQTHY